MYKRLPWAALRFRVVFFVEVGCCGFRWVEWVFPLRSGWGYNEIREIRDCP